MDNEERKRGIEFVKASHKKRVVLYMISPFRQKGKLEKKTTGLHFDCLFPVKRYGATMQLALKNARHSLHMSRDSTHARDTTPQVHLNSQTRQTTSYFTKVRTTNDPYRKTILH